MPKALSPRLEVSGTATVELTDKQREALARVRGRIAGGDYTLEAVGCPCEADHDITIANIDRYGLAVGTQLCMSCGLMRCSARFDQRSMARFYAEDYRDMYDPLGPVLHFETDVKAGQWMIRQMPKLFGISEVIFDIGCGTGGKLLPISALPGKRAVGCDFAPDFISHGRSRGVEIVEGGAAALVEKVGKRADLVILSHVAEHFLDLERELTEVIEAIKPGGFLFIEVPGAVGGFELPFYRSDILRYVQNAHAYYFTRQTLTAVLTSLGLQVLSMDENVSGAALKPLDWTPRPMKLPANSAEALRILSHLSKLESDILKGQGASAGT